MMTGDTKTPVVGGYLALIMDKILGSMFDQGLNNLKNKVEQDKDES